MHNIMTLAALWLSLAVLATMISYGLGIATALSEIMVGIAAQGILGTWLGLTILNPKSEWIQFLASIHPTPGHVPKTHISHFHLRILWI